MERASNSNLGPDATKNNEKVALLEHLINSADTNALNVGITIFVNGIIISSTLIRRKRCFD